MYGMFQNRRCSCNVVTVFDYNIGYDVLRTMI